MSSKKSGNRDSSKSCKENPGKPKENSTHNNPPWHHPSSKTEASALKAMLGKGMKKEVKIKKPDSKRDENEKLTNSSTPN